LIQHGANVNARDDDDRNALQKAASQGYESVVRLLIEHGVDINAQNNYHPGATLQEAFLGGWAAFGGLSLNRIFCLLRKSPKYET